MWNFTGVLKRFSNTFVDLCQQTLSCHFELFFKCKKSMKISTSTARKVSKCGVISGPYFLLLCKSPYSVQIQENMDQK